MESQLLERIYTGPVPASTRRPKRRPTETLPLGYEVAFGAYARRACDILAPDDFARGLVYNDGMDFEAFVTVNRIELLDDDESLAMVTTFPDPNAETVSIGIHWEIV